MKLKLQPLYQACFVFGLFGCFSIVNPYIPVDLRIALLPALVFGTAFGITEDWLRYVGVEGWKDDSRWGQLVAGVQAGTTTAILFLTVIHFYFGVPVVIPSL